MKPIPIMYDGGEVIAVWPDSIRQCRYDKTDAKWYLFVFDSEYNAVVKFELLPDTIETAAADRDSGDHAITPPLQPDQAGFLLLWVLTAPLVKAKLFFAAASAPSSISKLAAPARKLDQPLPQVN